MDHTAVLAHVHLQFGDLLSLVLVIGDISHLGDVVQLISQAGLPCPNGQRALRAVHGSSPTSGQLLSQCTTFSPGRLTAIQST